MRFVNFFASLFFTSFYTTSFVSNAGDISIYAQNVFYHLRKSSKILLPFPLFSIYLPPLLQKELFFMFLFTYERG
ncbi:hypothetical protein AUK10_00395 [Candidatus Gracilibacteria bacterium CG2_30_37_12]|nr:MAG: hypothetical protein AUK10_00395 [Candidatus Gracilibacteria bacterium CG2_30_37_12]